MDQIDLKHKIKFKCVVPESPHKVVLFQDVSGKGFSSFFLNRVADPQPLICSLSVGLLQVGRGSPHLQSLISASSGGCCCCTTACFSSEMCKITDLESFALQVFAQACPNMLYTTILLD